METFSGVPFAEEYQGYPPMIETKPDAPSVGIIPPLDSEGSYSMTRYANELQAGLLQFSPYSAEIISFKEGPIASVDTKVGKLQRYERRYIKYPRYLQLMNFDIYHVVDQSYSHLIRHLPPKRTVITCHDLNLLTQSEWSSEFRFRPRNLLSRWSTHYMKHAASVIAVSEATKRDLLRLGRAVDSQLSIIPPGLAPIFCPADQSDKLAVRASLGLSPKDFAVMHVGQDGMYKNLPGVVRTISELRNRGHTVKLVRAGKPLTEVTRQLARYNNLDSSIIDVGSISDETLAMVYSSCDCLLFPSLREGFGWPVLEAMACGLPVVTSHDPALLETSAGVGLSADAHDIDALADALELVLTSPGLADTMRRSGLDRSKQYSRQSTVEGIAAVYDKVMGSTNPT